MVAKQPEPLEPPRRGEAVTARTTSARIVFDLLVLACFVAAGIQATTFTPAGRWLPLYACVLGGIMALVVLLVDTRSALAGRKRTIATEPSDDTIGDSLRWLAWMAGYGLLVILMGMQLASIAWLAIVLRFVAKTSWIVTLATIAGVVALLYLLADNLPVKLPSGVLF